MRDILFRGKRKDNGEWMFGSYVRYNDYKDRYVNLIYGYSGFPNEIIPETLGQFTGLLDKNGKKIFEGDIVRWTHDYFGGEFLEKVEHQKINGVILWVEQVGKFMMKDTDNNHWDFKRIQTNQCFEIIGNIHEVKE